MAPLYPPIICRAYPCAPLVFFRVGVARSPAHHPFTSYGYFLLGSDHTRISGPVTATPRLPLHHTPTPHASRHGLGHGRTHGTTLGHGPVRLRPTRTTDRLTSPAWSRLLTPTGSLYGPGLDGSRPRQGRRLYTVQTQRVGHGMEPSSAQADSDSLKTSRSRPMRR